LKFDSNNTTEKSTLGRERTLSEANWLSTLSICFTVMIFGFQSQSSCSCQQYTSHPGDDILYMQHATNWFIRTLYLKLKAQNFCSFLYLPGMGSS